MRFGAKDLSLSATILAFAARHRRATSDSVDAMRTDVCLTLPDALRSDLDDYARLRGLPRSYAAQELLEQALATARPRVAVGAHLAEHQRLGFPAASDK
jgi:hypothetical protein